MNLTTQRRIAAKILNVGETRVWFDPERLKDIKEAITRADLKRLISSKAIMVSKEPYHSRTGARKILKQKKKGRRKGKGSRKGKKTARLTRKQNWINKIRVQRKFLRLLYDNGLLIGSNHRKVYNMAGGGFFRSKRHIKIYLEERSLINKK